VDFLVEFKDIDCLGYADNCEKNLMLKRAVERELEIIGEALKRALHVNDDLAIPNARRIIDLRNRLMHGSDKVDDGFI
jgi:uncharacterized protein with HEPN domain